MLVETRHRELLQLNKQTPKDYSKAIQHMIGLFDDTHLNYTKSTGKTRERLVEQLTALDGELYEEMLEEMADELNENAWEAPLKRVKIIKESNTLKTNPNHIIIKLLVQNGTQKIKKAQLEALGFKADWNKEISIENFLLTKMFGSYTYKIIDTLKQ